ncbi:metallophosphoesterase [Persicitalea sp.]|uniref:metallophosphoesterase n=1 Tax=Persicitalea sp. TaxID=3100273 RepID=UPI003593ED4E
MPKKHELKYLVLSDLHLGETDSLFTSREGGQSDLVTCFSKCLADLIKDFDQEDFPMMVLNGDILGLSFSSYGESLAVFEQFVAAFTHHHKVCDQVAYLPGNHDQHIWQLAQEEKFQEALEKRTKNEAFPALRHTTPSGYAEGFSSRFFQAFAPEGMKLNLKINYPNLLLPPTRDGGSGILIHHGHFAEPAYRFFSIAMQALYPELKPPSDLEALSEQNGSMIDFVYSELGRSGEAGEYFCTLMATLSSEELLEKHIDELAKNLAASVDFPYIPIEVLEEQLAKTLIQNIAETVRTERSNEEEVCSDKTMEGVMDYLQNYGLEVLEKQGCPTNKLTFIWGHTHKPFEKATSHAQIDNLRIFNTGGWVIPRKPVETIGASVLLIDQHNEVQALRIFNDGEDGGTMHFKVIPIDDTPSTFADSITEYLYPDGETLNPVWSSFKNKLQQEIKDRRKDEA